MMNVGTIILVALCLSLIGNRGGVKAQAVQPIDPQAAQQYASDSEKANRGDPEAAYRMGEALESGRLGGLKNINKALTFYKLAAQQGHNKQPHGWPNLRQNRNKPRAHRQPGEGK